MGRQRGAESGLGGRPSLGSLGWVVVGVSGSGARRSSSKWGRGVVLRGWLRRGEDIGDER